MNSVISDIVISGQANTYLKIASINRGMREAMLDENEAVSNSYMEEEQRFIRKAFVGF